MPYPPQFVDMQTDVIALLRLEDDLDRPKVKDWINASYMEACVDVELYLQAAASTPLAPSTGTVTVPAALLMLNYVVPSGSDGSRYGPMRLVGIDEILESRAYSGGTITQSVPYMYAYLSSAQPTIEIWPTAAGGETLTFYGVRLPDPLAADADVPIIPEPFGSNVLVYGAASLAAEFKQNYIMMSTYAQEAAQWVVKLRGFMNNRAGNKVQQFRVEGAQRPVPSTNAVDIR